MIRAEPVTALDLRCNGRAWAFETAHREAIARHWEKVTAANPKLWNGRTLICTKAAVEQGVFRAELAEIDYASFVAWRDWGRPDASVVNCFGVPAVFSADGALLLGVMSASTLNAGKAYPPSGSLEPKDVRPDGEVDILANMRTELFEETGLDLGEARPGPMAAIFEGPRLAVVQRFDFPLSFAAIERRFAIHAAADPHAELSAVEALRHGSQIDSRMPGYVAELVRFFQL
ncbi:NUDIX hydrolase [Aestuariivirga sp.]|uniref:NUDIX hydrolase n=1 Tax=Aestuariivirga sp. TaxID=2650926 RepID=UPI0035B2D8B5